MSDSNITKRALASSLKELMEEIPFSKITVADICGKCGMNRKSFYYHFKDKYDLVNWIYDSEYVSAMQGGAMPGGWDRLFSACRYFFENRSFYRRLLQLRGQNSFSDHLREILRPLLAEDILQILTEKGQHELLADPIAMDFYINFFTDAFLSSLERWLTNKDCIPPERFIRLLRSCVQITVDTAELL